MRERDGTGLHGLPTRNGRPETRGWLPPSLPGPPRRAHRSPPPLSCRWLPCPLERMPRPPGFSLEVPWPPEPEGRLRPCSFLRHPPSPSHTGPPARAFHMGRVTAFCLLGCLLWKWPGDVCSSACVCSGHIVLGLGLPLWEPCFFTFPPPPLSTKRDMS